MPSRTAPPSDPAVARQPSSVGQPGPAFFMAVNNVRKNLLRLYRRQTWRVSHLLLFPVVFLYYELLLRLYGGSSFFQSLIYPVLFALGLGLFTTCFTCVFRPKVNRIISLVILYVTGLFFVVECLIQDSYQVYMTLGSIRTGAGGVVGGFGSELFRAILHGIPKIFFFFLPAILYTATGRRRMPARRFHLPFVGMILV